MLDLEEITSKRDECKKEYDWKYSCIVHFKISEMYQVSKWHFLSQHMLHKQLFDLDDYSSRQIFEFCHNLCPNKEEINGQHKRFK